MLFWKNTIKVLLKIGRHKHKLITKNYRTADVRDTIAKKKIKLIIDTPQACCHQHLLDLAKENGDSHAIRFTTDHSKLLVRHSELDTIKIPSCLSKFHLH